MHGIAAQTGCLRKKHNKERCSGKAPEGACLRGALKRPSPALPARPSVAWPRLEPWRVVFWSATHRSKEHEQALALRLPSLCLQAQNSAALFMTQKALLAYLNLPASKHLHLQHQLPLTLDNTPYFC